MIRILIVDDEKAIRLILKTYLTMAGYAVEVAEDAMCAQAIMKDGNFDIVLSDIMLPTVSGVDLMRVIRQTYPKVLVILMTGMPTVETASEAVRAGAFDYLSKPFQREAILRVVANAVKVKELDEERERLARENRQYAERLEQMVAERTEELRETGARLHLAVAASNIGLWDWDLRTHEAHFSPEWKRQLGYADDELPSLYAEWENRLHPDDRERTLAAIAASTAPPWPGYEVEYRLRHKDGTYRWIYVRGNVSRDADDKPLRIMGGHVDITERKQGEVALRESESHYRRLFETARDGILILDAGTGRIVDVNPFLIELLGYPRDYYLNRVLWEIPLFKDVALSKAAFAELQEKGHIGCEDLPMDTRDGRRIEVEFVSHFYQSGDRKAIQCNVRNVTGRNTALTHLRNLNEMQSKFVAEASHEIRTPLTIIKESVLQVLDGVCGSITGDQREILTLCLQGIERLKAVVDDLLDISKLEAGKTILFREPVDMTRLLEEIRATFLPQARAKGLALELIGPPREIPVYIDRGRMLQVLTNLVGNALKFTTQGHIHLSVSDEGENIECSVADTGIGISEADIPKVFGRFLQFGTPWTGPGGGTGLGLSIAKSLVELHGGKIRVKSAVNQGTVFTFTVPRFGEEQVLHDRVDATLAHARRENKEVLLALVRFEHVPSSGSTGGGSGPGAAMRETADKLEAAIRGKSFTTARGKDCLVVFAAEGKERAAETGVALRDTIKRCVFECDEHLRTAFGYGFCVYPRDGENAQTLLTKAQESLVSDHEARARKRILIVDDDASVITLLKADLSALGYQNVAAAADGIEALKKATESIPGLIILDIQMPKLDGYEFIGRLKRNSLTAKVPLLIMTGFPIDSVKLEKQSGSEVVPILSKPLNVDTVGKWARFLL